MAEGLQETPGGIREASGDSKVTTFRVRGCNFRKKHRFLIGNIEHRQKKHQFCEAFLKVTLTICDTVERHFKEHQFYEAFLKVTFTICDTVERDFEIFKDVSSGTPTFFLQNLYGGGPDLSFNSVTRGVLEGKTKDHSQRFGNDQI